ncbi:MAG: four helix bundle protein [Paludibacteraceae bacterium]|nr:four helix bundle protein [Paludibacteraceae bacterium]MBN2787585.1 four helix bundle protein [Paludibacteraceae bacterium]
MSVGLEKSMDFAVRIVNLYNYLCKEKNEFVLSKQILRSGTSIGAMLNEGKYGESDLDFIHKFSIAQKECAETLYWLLLLYKTNYISEQQYKSLSDNANELIKLITSSIRTVKRRINKPVNR